MLHLQSSSVDYQHAVIEYSETEECYVLQDLNTAQGTYVNECRVQNAAVRLAPGDIMRFGYGGSPYELVLEHHGQVCEFNLYCFCMIVFSTISIRQLQADGIYSLGNVYAMQFNAKSEIRCN